MGVLAVFWRCVGGCAGGVLVGFLMGPNGVFGVFKFLQIPTGRHDADHQQRTI